MKSGVHLDNELPLAAWEDAKRPAEQEQSEKH